MKKLSLAFFGTPQFAADILEKLILQQNNSIDIKLIITQPDKPVGKKQLRTPSPVKLIGNKYEIPVYDGSAKNQQLMNLLREKSIDIVLLFAYGEIITKELLSIPRFGFWNIHPSLLPLYRGASPIAYPLLHGDVKTGVSIMQMDEKLDHGPIIAQAEMDINITDTRLDLEEKLVRKAFELIQAEFDKIYLSNSLPETTIQKHTDATFTSMLHKNDGFIPFTVIKKAITGDIDDFMPEIVSKYYLKNSNCTKIQQSLPSLLYNLYRALYPWPGLWTVVTIKGQEKRLKITDVKLMGNNLIITKVQLEGKKEVDTQTFNRAYSLF